MGRRAWIGVAFCCVALAAVCVLPTAAVAAESGSGAPAASLQQDRAALQGNGSDYFQSLELRLRVQPDGDGVWIYRYEYPIEDQDERQAFEDYAERFRTEELAVYRDWRAGARNLTASTEAELDRSMAAVDFDREADVDPTPTRDVGYVEMRYRWTNFAQTSGDEVVVGDVFVGGLYLAAGQELVFVADGNLTFDSVAPEASTSAGSLEESRSVSWTGERSFPDRQPRATLVVEDGTGGATDDASMAFVEPLVLGGGLALLVLALLAVAFVRGDLPQIGPLGDADEPSATVATNGSAATARQPDAAATPESESVDEPGDASALPDDQRVVALLEASEGRLKQSAIVDETEWSKSKVSMLLSEMEEEGTISKIQVGRENIIALEGNEPEAAGSPFDDTE